MSGPHPHMCRPHPHKLYKVQPHPHNYMHPNFEKIAWVILQVQSPTHFENQVRLWVQTTAKNCAWGFSLTLDWIGKRTLPYILTVELPNGVNMFFHPRLYNSWCSFRCKIGFISRENFFQKGLNTYTIDLPSYLHLIVTNTMYCVIVVIQRLLPEKSRTGKFFLDFVIPIIMDLM